MEGRRPTADSRSQFWLMCMRCCVLAGCVDVALFFIFHYLGSPILAWINVFSVPMYAIAWWALKTRRNVLALTLIWIEVLIHATLGSLLIGWEAGFYYYLLMFIPALFAGNRSYRRAALTVVALWLFYIGLDTAAESLSRIANRVRRGGHDIPENDVERRFAGRWEAVEKILPYCDEAEFYDNDNGFVKVAEYRNGELRTVGKHRPKWLNELQAYLG